MARDPSITVRERLIYAARRWAALYDLDPLKPREEREMFRRVGDLSDAVTAYEKLMGLRHLTLKIQKRKAKTYADGFRDCEFCGCHTNAKLRACCDAGCNADRAASKKRASQRHSVAGEDK